MSGSHDSPYWESWPSRFERVDADGEELVQMDVDVGESTSRLALLPDIPDPARAQRPHSCSRQRLV